VIYRGSFYWATARITGGQGRKAPGLFSPLSAGGVRGQRSRRLEASGGRNAKETIMAITSSARMGRVRYAWRPAATRAEAQSRRRRSPAHPNLRREQPVNNPRPKGSEGTLAHDENLDSFRTPFYEYPNRASLRSENCPIWIGIGVRITSESVSAFVGIRTFLEPYHFCLDSGVLDCH